MNEQLNTQLLLDIAGHLPEATLNVEHRGRINLGTQGAAIYLRHPCRKESHVQVNVQWPRDSQNNYYAPTDYDREMSGGVYEINIAMSKGPERIAEEIKKRLLEHYLRDYAVLKARCDASDTYAINTVKSARQFAQDLGLEFQHDSRNHCSPSIYFDRGNAANNVNGTAKFAGERVTLELHSLTVDEAVKVVRLLREARQWAQEVAA